MKAAMCNALTGISSITIENIDAPRPGPGEVVVDVKAAALNFFDTLITRGKYQFKPELPFSPAGEICGVVSELGDSVSDIAVGSRVMAYVGWGGAREKIAVPAETVVPVPDDVSDEVAASLCITYGTAMHGLIDRGEVQAGETVAVLGAAGGAGLAAVEISKLLGARVIAVASSEEKLAICRDAGADEVLDYETTDLKKGLKLLTNGRGVEVVYDCVGGDMCEPAVRAMAWEGRYLVVGFASGNITKLPLNLLLLKGCSAVGVFWGEALKRDVARHCAKMAKLMGWIGEGKLNPLIGRTFHLEQIVEALGVIKERRAQGKVVLLIP